MDNINSEEIKELCQVSNNDLTAVTHKIIKSPVDSNLNELINEFNANQAKKNALRILKYNELLDNISNEITNRFNNNSEEFTNSDLINYLQSIQGLVDKSNKYVNNIPESSITINQINISNNKTQTFDAESRHKIRDIVQSILNDKYEKEILIEGDEDERTGNTDEESGNTSSI